MTIELKSVVKRVGAETHLYETDLALAERGFNILLGSTGAGKTTLIKILAGLEKITSGAVWMNGRDVTKVSPARAQRQPGAPVLRELPAHERL